MDEENIWQELELSEDNFKTAYDYLISQIDNFNKASKYELSMEVEVKQLTSADGLSREMTLYTLIIVAPHLENLRKTILHVAEFVDQGLFPVNIFCHIDDFLEEDIAEKDLLSAIKGILSKKIVQNSIESLFQESIESRKKNLS